MSWFVCGLIAGFIVGLWCYDNYLQKEHPEFYEKLVERIMEKLRRNK